MKSEMSALTKRLAPLLAPLKKREESAAIKVARTYLSKELSDHFRIFGAELRIEKPLEPRKAPVRLIGVLVVDYGNRRNVEVLVQPEGKVVRVDDLGTAQPSYTREEIAEARMIAERHGLSPRCCSGRVVKGHEFSGRQINYDVGEQPGRPAPCKSGVAEPDPPSIIGCAVWTEVADENAFRFSQASDAIVLFGVNSRSG